MIYSENILVCIAIPLIIAAFFTTRNTRRFICAFVIGMVVCLLSAYISGFIRSASGVKTEDMAIYYAPIIEEIMKVLPLVFYIFVFMGGNSEIVTVSLGIGLGFATFENCCYILASGAPSLAFVIVRGMAVGVMHLVCALALVMGLVHQRRYFNLALPGVVGALSLSTVFHGLYNLLVSEPGISTYFGYIMPIVTAVGLYFPYRAMKRSEELHKKENFQES